MKIAFLVPDFPRLGQTFILGQLEGLLARGHEVVVYARRPEGAALDDRAAERFAARRREQPALRAARLPRTLSGLALVARHGWRHPRLVARTLDPSRLGRYALSFAALHAAVPLLDRPTFDVVHCHFGPAGVIGAMLQEIGALHGPIVTTFYGHDVTRYPRERGAHVYRRLFERAALVLALDPVMRERLEALGAAPSRLDVQPLAIDCDRFAPPEDPASRPPLRLLSVGRLVEKKGFADGVQACARLVAQGHAVEYRIAGEGPLGPDLRRLVDDLGLQGSVSFPGHVSHEDVPALMRSSHVLLAPSVRAADGDEEGTPTVINEAMACGLPVVATRHAGIASQVTDEETGWLVDEGDPEALADRIARLADPALASRLGSAGRAAAVDRFDADRLTSRLETLYASVAGERAVDRYTPGRDGAR